MRISSPSSSKNPKWILTLTKFAQNDTLCAEWKEEFDAVVLATGMWRTSYRSLESIHQDKDSRTRCFIHSGIGVQMILQERHVDFFKLEPGLAITESLFGG